MIPPHVSYGVPHRSAFPFGFIRSLSVCILLNQHIMSSQAARSAHYRADGVRIHHDPTAPDLKDHYGAPGQTDDEGFDPYADTVGAGIYGGKVKKDPSTGEVLYGKQYQNHNPTPGPIYAAGGYTEINKALGQGEAAIAKLLERDPALVNEISTGGATPLHMCGMSRENQKATAYLISRGANIEALDTYGYRPLHRMASNNLDVGAEALLAAGASVNAATTRGETAMRIARASEAAKVIEVLRKYGAK